MAQASEEFDMSSVPGLGLVGLVWRTVMTRLDRWPGAEIEHELIRIDSEVMRPCRQVTRCYAPGTLAISARIVNTRRPHLYIRSVELFVKQGDACGLIPLHQNAFADTTEPLKHLEPRAYYLIVEDLDGDDWNVYPALLIPDRAIITVRGSSRHQIWNHQGPKLLEDVGTLFADREEQMSGPSGRVTKLARPS